jgi:hypothetical protein
MTKLWTIVTILVSFLLVAPVIESGTTDAVHVFQAAGNAESGGGE